MDITITIFINELETNGLTTIPNAISVLELDRLRDIYDSNWNEIKEQLECLDWKLIRFNSRVQTKTGFVGKNIYDGKLVASYPRNGDSQIINMGNSRYDFTYGFTNIKLNSPIVNTIMENLLCCEFSSYIGALPILAQTRLKDTDIVNNKLIGSQGVWHRDAYSLFDDETIDLMLKPFYYTVLIPLDDIDLHNRTTEFILGSHHVNLNAKGIHNIKDLEKYYENGIARYKLKCKAGDVCIFHGYLIHRGLDTCIDNVRICYAVFKKNWYNDEPEENYILEESGIIIK